MVCAPALTLCRGDWTTFEPVHQGLAVIECTFGDDWGSMSNNWQELVNTCRYLARQLSNLNSDQFTLLMLVIFTAISNNVFIKMVKVIVKTTAIIASIMLGNTSYL